MQFKSISGEVKSADLSQITAFLKLIEEKMQAYDPKDIWNCDETALQYKNPLTKSYVTKDDDCVVISFFFTSVVSTFTFNIKEDITLIFINIHLFDDC